MKELKEFIETEGADYSWWLMQAFNDAYLDQGLDEISEGIEWLIDKYVDKPKELEVVNNAFIALTGYGLVSLVGNAKEQKENEDATQE